MERMSAKMSARESLNNFLSQPDKPFILALCRPDGKKNIDGLLHAYGTDKNLQALANLVIFAGIRSDIEKMAPGEREVLTEILLLMDRYNLYGKIAIPKKHDVAHEVPEIYRLCAERKGVFINIALTEPFGLTILEATASGCPVVATEDGGPAEILPNCCNGYLVPPLDSTAIQKALTELLVDPERWNECSRNGIENIRKHYSWEAHALRYVELVKENLEASSGLGRKNLVQNSRLYERLKNAKQMIICDVDGTLVSEDGNFSGLSEFSEWLRNLRGDLVFGVASGRSLKSLQELFEQHQLPTPDVVICNVGTRINYGFNPDEADKAWGEHIDFRWNKDAVIAALKDLPGLRLQEAELQTAHKVSWYYAAEETDSPIDEQRIQKHLGRLARNASIIITHGSYLDVLPKRASKGRAIRFISQKWNITPRNTIVFGDAGNDLDMFTGATLGVVVANHSPEMEVLRGLRQVYFSPHPCALGVLDGLKKFQFKTNEA